MHDLDLAKRGVGRGMNHQEPAHEFLAGTHGLQVP